MSRTKNETNPSLDLGKATGRWANEGGALPAPPDGRPLELAEVDERLLRRLGAAVVLRWDALPVEVQRDLFESAASVEDPGQHRALTQQLGRYLHRQRVG